MYVLDLEIGILKLELIWFFSEIGINLVLFLSDYVAEHYFAAFAFSVQTVLIKPHCAQKEENR